MTTIRWDRFIGAVPLAEPTKLGAGFAPDAINCLTENGNLAPFPNIYESGLLAPDYAPRVLASVRNLAGDDDHVFGVPDTLGSIALGHRDPTGGQHVFFTRRGYPPAVTTVSAIAAAYPGFPASTTLGVPTPEPVVASASGASGDDLLQEISDLRFSSSPGGDLNNYIQGSGESAFRRYLFAHELSASGANNNQYRLQVSIEANRIAGKHYMDIDFDVRDIGLIDYFSPASNALNVTLSPSVSGYDAPGHTNDGMDNDDWGCVYLVPAGADPRTEAVFVYKSGGVTWNDTLQRHIPTSGSVATYQPLITDLVPYLRVGQNRIVAVSANANLDGYLRCGFLLNLKRYTLPAEVLDPTSTFYGVTFVNAFGQEGPASDPSNIITLDSQESVSVAISLPAVDAGLISAYNLVNRRIYRANTGGGGTELQLVDTLPVSVTSYTDTKTNDSLAEVLVSDAWAAPPGLDHDFGPMQGITAFGGFLVGFTGPLLCMSAVGVFSAWPTEYRKLLNANIMGVVATQNGLVICTDGRPYMGIGITPESFQVTELDTLLPCVSYRSIIDMGDYALYASAAGLVRIGSGGAQVITAGLISQDGWLGLYPKSMMVHRFGKRCLFLHNPYDDFSATDAGPNILYASRRGFIVDPESPERGLSFIDLDAGVGDIATAFAASGLPGHMAAAPLGNFDILASYTSSKDGISYILCSAQNTFHFLASDSALPGLAFSGALRWVTNEVVLPEVQSFGAMYVHGSGAGAVDITIRCDDDEHVFLGVALTPYTAVRLPGGVFGRRVSVIVDAPNFDVQVRAITLASTNKELSG